MNQENQSDVKLNCRKRRNTDLGTDPGLDSWTQKLELDDYLLDSGSDSRSEPEPELTLNDMKWLSYSHYGKITGLGKFFDQFKSIDDMIAKMYVKPFSMHHRERYGDNSAKYIKDWLLENYPGFNDIKVMEVYLNKLIEERELELLGIGVKRYSDKNEDGYFVGRYSNPYDVLRERISLTYDHKLWGYFRAANPHQKYIYVITRISDPVPAKYDAMFHLGDAYKLLKDQASYPAISKMDRRSKNTMVYNSQFVIYKICA